MFHPFITLGITEDASDAEVRQAYLRKVHEFPPEKAPARFQQVSEAYETIKDEIGRARIRLFGILGGDTGLTDLVPETGNARRRIGMKLWRRAMTEAADE